MPENKEIEIRYGFIANKEFTKEFFEKAIVTEVAYLTPFKGCDSTTCCRFRRRNGKATKGVFGTTNNELKGVLICGSVAAVIGINFNNAQHIYYNRALTDNITKDCGITEAEYIAVPYEKTPITA